MRPETDAAWMPHGYEIEHSPKQMLELRQICLTLNSRMFAFEKEPLTRCRLHGSSIPCSYVGILMGRSMVVAEESMPPKRSVKPFNSYLITFVKRPFR